MTDVLKYIPYSFSKMQICPSHSLKAIPPLAFIYSLTFADVFTTDTPKG